MDEILTEIERLVNAGDFKDADKLLRPIAKGTGGHSRYCNWVIELENRIVDHLIENTPTPAE